MPSHDVDRQCIDGCTHFDFNDNIACVAHGRRRFMLFPPSNWKTSMSGPRITTGCAISLVDAHNPDLARYRGFEQAPPSSSRPNSRPGRHIHSLHVWHSFVSGTVQHPDQLLVERRAPTGGCAVSQPAAWRACHRELAERTAGHMEEILDHYVFQSTATRPPISPRSARTARQPLTGTIGTVHRSHGASAERHAWNSRPVPRQPIGNTTKMSRRRFVKIRRVLACHGVDHGKSADGVAAADQDATPINAATDAANHLMVDVHINGNGPYHFVVDTGATALFGQ